MYFDLMTNAENQKRKKRVKKSQKSVLKTPSKKKNNSNAEHDFMRYPEYTQFEKQQIY